MRSLFAVGVLAVLAQVVHAGPIHTVVLPSGGTPLTLTIPSGRLLKVYNFVHDGASSGKAVLTKNAQTGTILESIPIGNAEFHRTFLVAGSASVVINPPGDGSVTISYQFADNTD